MGLKYPNTGPVYTWFGSNLWCYQQVNQIGYEAGHDYIWSGSAPDQMNQRYYMTNTVVYRPIIYVRPQR